MKFVHNDYDLHTSKELIVYNSCILKRIIEENVIDNKVTLESFLDHIAVKYVFENLLLYPYLQSKTYMCFDELIKNLNVVALRPVIEYYQMEKLVFLLNDLINKKEIFCIEELKNFFALKKYFSLSLPSLNAKIFNFILKNIIEDNIEISELDKNTLDDFTYLILKNIKPYYVYQEMPSKYIIDLDKPS